MKEFPDKKGNKLSYYSLVKGRNCTDEIIKEKNLNLLNEPVAQTLYEKYGKILGQAILNEHIHIWSIPILGTLKATRTKENLESTNLEWK